MPKPNHAAIEDCIIIFDIDEQKYLFISPLVSSIFGLSPLQFNNYAWYALIAEHQRNKIDEQVKSLLVNEFIELNYEIITSPHTTKHITDKKSLQIDELTGHTILLSVIKPYSPQVDLSLTENASAQKLDSFIESITDSFLIVDKKWRFVKINSAFEKITGRSRKEMLGQIIWEVFPSISETGFGSAYHDAVKKNKSVKFIEYFEPLGKWFSTSVYPSAEGLTIYVKDITHERQAQEQALWTKNSLEALINNTNDHIWSVDAKLRYVYMNEAYIKQMLHVTGKQPKQGDTFYFHKDFGQQTINEWEAYYLRALNGERYTITYKSLHPYTQVTLFYEVSFNPIYTREDEIIGVGCFASDITSRLKTEQELLDQNERLRNIAALSSHEIRRPVASLMGLISILDRKNFFNPENEDIIEHLFTVGTEIDAVIRLIVDNTFTGKY